MKGCMVDFFQVSSLINYHTNNYLFSFSKCSQIYSRISLDLRIFISQVSSSKCSLSYRKRKGDCLDGLKVIEVIVENQSVLEIRKTATVTIIDMISNIGGTLGLFSGFSILCLLEVLYWMWLAVAKGARKRTTCQ